jgi:L-ascorbate metabolism protein UlaG (beta-lactamase superfamily)
MDGLTYIGHATTLLRLDRASILTDPALRRWLGPLRRQGPPAAELRNVPDAVLISHLHRDHLDLPSLRRLPASTPLVVPLGAGKWVTRAGAEHIRELARGETISVGGVEVTAVPAVHDGRRDRWGPRIDPLGYVIAGAGCTVYFAGDTDLFPEMNGLADSLDLALLPVAGWGAKVGAGHLDPERAARAVQLLHPRLAVPIHWGTYSPPRRSASPDPPEAFRRHAASLAPDVEVRIVAPGESLSF